MSCGFYFHSPLGFLACIEANRSWFTQSLSKNMADWGSSPLWLDGTHQVLIRNNYIECINQMVLEPPTATPLD